MKKIIPTEGVARLKPVSKGMACCDDVTPFVLQTLTVVCVGAATCWTSPWPCTVSSSPPVTSWKSWSFYILQPSTVKVWPLSRRRLMALAVHCPHLELRGRLSGSLCSAFYWLSLATSQRVCSRLCSAGDKTEIIRHKRKKCCEFSKNSPLALHV